MFDEIYQDIDRPIDRGEEVWGVSDVLYPQWPVNFLLLQQEICLEKPMRAPYLHLQPSLPDLPEVRDPLDRVTEYEDWNRGQMGGSLLLEMIEFTKYNDQADLREFYFSLSCSVSPIRTSILHLQTSEGTEDFLRKTWWLNLHSFQLSVYGNVEEYQYYKRS